MLSVISMPKRREGEILAQKVFMCPVSLLQAIKDEAQKTGQSESEIIREALGDRLRAEARSRVHCAVGRVHSASDRASLQVQLRPQWLPQLLCR